AGDHGGGHRRVDLRVLGREALIEARLRRQIALAGAGAQQRRYRHRGETRAKAHPWTVESHPGPPFPLSNRYAATAWQKHGGRARLRRLIFPCRQERAALRAMGNPQIPHRAAATTERSMPALVDRRRLREEAFQDVIADSVVLLVERGMRDARHHGELL